MSLVTQIPTLVHIRFVPDKDQPPQYNMKHFDDVLFSENIGDWQTQLDYLQPVQLDDRITIQVHTQNNDIFHSNPPVLELLDQNLKVLANLNTVSGGAYYKGIITYAGNYYNDVLLDTSLWTGRASAILGANLEGVYYFRITNTDGIDTEVFYSEPMQFKTYHPGTAIIKYGNLTSKQDLVVDGFSVTPQHGLRVPLDIRPPVPVANFVAYNDVAFNQHLLSATSIDNFDITIGGYEGVPNYIMQKISAIFCTDWRTIDGKSFEYNDSNGGNNGSATTPIIQISAPNPLYPLVVGKIAMKRTDNRDAYTYLSNRILLWQRPGSGGGTFPYSLMPFFFLQDSHGTSYVGKAVIFNDSAAETDFLNNYLKTTYTDDNDLEGVFSTDGAGGFFYEPADQEPFVETIIATSTTYMTISQTTTVANTTSKFDFSAGQFVIDWGDSSAAEWWPSFGGTATAAHLFAATGNQTLRIFTDNNVISMTLYPFGATPAAITALGGTVSSALKYFQITGYDMSGAASMDFSFLVSAMARMNQLIINCKIKAFSPGLFAGVTASSMTQITYVSLTQNELTSSGVDAVINGFKAAYARPGGVFYIKNQIPPAAPTSSSSSARSALATSSWSVITD